MGPEIYNLYVEKLIQEVSELTKVKILMSAQLSYYEKNNAELVQKIDDLEKALHKANNKSPKKQEAGTDF